MFSYKAVHYVAFFSILAVICQMCSAISDIEDNDVFHDGNFKEELEQNIDSPYLYVTEESGNAPVAFITERSSIVETKREDQDRGNVFFKHWARERLRYAEKLTGIEIPLREKRVVRQVNPGYSSLYPTLPTKSVYGNYGPYSNNSETNSYSYGHAPNATIQNPYNYPNFSATGQNLYYNPQYPSHNAVNPYHSQPGVNKGVFPYIRPANNSGTLITTTQFYPGGNNYSQNPSYPPPYGRHNNGSYSNIPQPTGKPYYPGSTNGMHPGYPAPSSRPYYSSATSNYTNPYSQSTSRPAYPGATNNSTNSGFPQPYGRPAHPGSTYNITNTGYFPSTNRSGYPGATKNGMTPVYPQPGNRPVYLRAQNHTYPPSTGKPFYPGTNNVDGNPSNNHYTYPINGNFSNPSFNNNNNYSKPYNNLPNSPYNTQTRYPPYNPNYNSSSLHGPVPGTQRLPYNNSGQTWGGNFQGYGHSSLSPYSTTPSHGSYNYYTTMPNAQYFGNTPNRPYSQSNGPYSDATWNKPNPSLNQYNAGAEFNNFFYPYKNNGSQYDPHKNPPNQFSYHVRK